ncbi:DegT/DnrJ/EryC1/StrS family aminotransferase [Natrarchaeobius chitinivorans]|uniref:DegT/DnrJ/EryC1/StrS aminotransferase family protein n=1 Tax=Natrarchaeobius chitinivorans TaxID=1679083 RepID=A0A3N6M5I2_NATCH|nr:DegT/DnrJ/EryC1/StrS family aminotransferase [Natrarchaeobius chitinivorans]RQG97327.1 DegT/DnrJ/EryC1/StrS aminotransferase family protein [Natrarchaeobius chitinivorans]
MINGTPSLFVSTLSDQRPVGVEPFLDRYAREFTYYGSGKVALRDGLAGLVEPGENVVLPAYLPDAVAEPLVELGLEVRYYRVEPSLAPDLADLERRIDDDTVAAVSVNYFGFPQPGLEEFVSLVSEYDCYHVDDNAHAPFSVDRGTLLGTRGHLGITSLWKMLPIPDGAVLYRSDDSVIDRYEPSSLAGVRDGIGSRDCRFVATSIVDDLFGTNGAIRQSIDALVAGRGESPAVGGQRERYERSKQPMSKLSMYVLEDADPGEIRSARRENYRAWRDHLEGRDDVELLYESLPDGICPQVLPVRAIDAESFLAELEACGIDGVHTWPRLSPTVLDDPSYETTRRLSRSIVTLPVHQQIDPVAIDEHATELGQ